MNKQNLGPIIFGSVILVAAVLVGAWLMGYWEPPPPTPPPPAAAYIYHPPPVPDAPVEVPPPAATPTEAASEEAPPPDPTLAQEMEKQAADQAAAEQQAAEAQQAEMQRQGKAIELNLRQLASAGQQYMLDKGVTEASYQDLVGTATDNYIRSIAPVAGENYESMTIYQTTTQVSITTPDGRVVQYNL